MKNFAKRAIVFAMSVAMLASTTAAIGASATSASTPDADKKYTITITPSSDADVTDTYDGNLYAFQIFSGTVPDKQPDVDVKGDDNTVQNPGTNGSRLQLTDIKWGSGIKKARLKDYILALANSEYIGVYFNNLVVRDVSNEATDIADTYKEGSGLAENKLAVAVAQILGEAEFGSRQNMQYFADITGGYYVNVGDTSLYNDFLDESNRKTATKGSDGNWVFNDLEAGYYLIRAYDSAALDHNAYPARMLFVASNITQHIKESVPVFDKAIVRDDTSDDTTSTNLKDTEVAGVGDIVEYQLKGTLPTNYEKYVQYEYIFNDTLSKGLDVVDYTTEQPPISGTQPTVEAKAKGLFKYVSEGTTAPADPASYDIAINTGKLEDDKEVYSFWKWNEEKVLTFDATDYTVSYTKSTDSAELKIDFNDLKQIELSDKDEPGAKYILGFFFKGTGATEPTTHIHDGGLDEKHSSRIMVNYKAQINENAIVNPKDGDNLKGNPNNAYLTYSNDPQTYESTSTTTTSTSTVYTFGLDLTKLDYANYLNDDRTGLENAGFAILRKGTDSWEIAVLNNDVSNSSSSFGTFAYYGIETWEPLTDGSGSVSTGTTGMDLVKAVNSYLTSKSLSGNIYEVVTNSDGKANLSGLDSGEAYTLVETKLPGTSGEYAQLDPFEFTLTAAIDGDGEYDGKISKNDVPEGFDDDTPISYEHFAQSTEADGADANGIAPIDVINFKYENLPSTGGEGVYKYYIIGGCIAAVGVTMLVLSKKKKKNEA